MKGTDDGDDDRREVDRRDQGHERPRPLQPGEGARGGVRRLRCRSPRGRRSTGRRWRRGRCRGRADRVRRRADELPARPRSRSSRSSRPRPAWASRRRRISSTRPPARSSPACLATRPTSSRPSSKRPGRPSRSSSPLRSRRPLCHTAGGRRSRFPGLMRSPQPALARAKARLDPLALYPRPGQPRGVRIVAAPWLFRLPWLRRFDGYATHRVILVRARVLTGRRRPRRARALPRLADAAPAPAHAALVPARLRRRTAMSSRRGGAVERVATAYGIVDFVAAVSLISSGVIR